MQWVEVTGKTVEEAKDVALERLGVAEDDADIEVLAEARVGLFGRLKEPARVRARVRPKPPRPKDDRRRRRDRRRRGGDATRSRNGGRSRNAAGVTSGKKEQRADADSGGSTAGSGGGGRSRRRRRGGGGQKTAAPVPTAPADQETTAGADGRASDETVVPTPSEDTSMTKPTMTLTEQADIAERFVTGLAERFATSVTVSRVEVDESTIRLDVAGDDLGLLIGRGGATATAIEELMRTVLQRHAGSTRDARVKLDIGGFRARRNEALAAFVRRVAADVRSTGTAKALEPMGAADRKIVHDVIADEEGVTTTSEGEDPRRRVVIVPDD